jgi:hypothetical protein
MFAWRSYVDSGSLAPPRWRERQDDPDDGGGVKRLLK